MDITKTSDGRFFAILSKLEMKIIRFCVGDIAPRNVAEGIKEPIKNDFVDIQDGIYDAIGKAIRKHRRSKKDGDTKNGQ